MKTLVIEFQALWHLYEKEVFEQESSVLPLWNQLLSWCLLPTKRFTGKKKTAHTKAEKTYGDYLQA